MSAQEVLLKNFQNNLQRSRDFIRLADFYEFRNKLRKMMREPMIRRIERRLGSAEEYSFVDQLVEKRFLPFAERLKRLYEAGCPQILVYSVSCLEDYLREICSLYGKPIGKESLQSVKGIERIFGEGVFKRRKKLKIEMAVIFEIRHVIVHKGGRIDKNAIQKVNAVAQSKFWDESMKSSDVRSLLDSKRLKHYIQTLEKFATIVM